MGVGHLPVFSLVWDVIAEGSEVSLLLQEIVFSRWKKNCVHGFRWEKKRIPMVCKTSEFPLQWSCASKNTDTRELVVGWVAFCRWRLIYSSRGYDINHDPSGGGATCYPLVILATGNFPFKRLLIDCLDKQRAVGFLGKSGNTCAQHETWIWFNESNLLSGSWTIQSNERILMEPVPNPCSNRRTYGFV